MQSTAARFPQVNSVSCQIQRNCNFAYLCLSIQLNVSLLLLVVCRQFDARYSKHFLPNTCARTPVFVMSPLDGEKSTEVAVLQYLDLSIQLDLSPLLLLICR
jgi:hypothetical protein